MRFIVEYDIHPYSKTWDVPKNADIYNSNILWHPDRVNYDIRKGYCIYNMQVKKQINHADSFTFVMPKGHPAYNIFSTFDERRLLGISVAVRWENSNQCLFFGRAVSISTDIYYQKTVTCEGCFAFLNDIMLRPTTFLASDPNPVEPVTPTQNGNESSSSTTTTPAKESDPLSYDYRTKQWHEYADYVMRKHSERMCNIAMCYKRSFRYAVRQGGKFSPDVPEYVDLGYTTANIIENQYATTLMVRNPLTGVQSYVTPKQYDTVTVVNSTPWVKFVCDYNNAIPRASLIWRYPTTEEAQPAQEYQDNWSFSEMSARTAGTTLITDQDKRWTGVDDYTPVMDAINDIIGTDSRYIGYAYATIGMGNVNPSDNNVRLFLYVHSPQIATRHNSTIMDITKNVVDISESGNSFETYSALIPLDKNKKTLDDDYNQGHKSEYKTVYWTDPKSGERLHNPNTILNDVTGFVDQNYNPEGYIEKTVTFNDIDVDNANDHPSAGEDPPIGKTILLQRANEVIAQSANVSVREFSISMVDLSLLSHTNREPFVSNTSKYVDLGYTDEEITDNQEAEQLIVYDRSTGISKTIIPKIFDKVVCTYYNPDRTYICEYSDGAQSNIWRRATGSDTNNMVTGWGDHSADQILSTNNFIDIGHRVPFRCEAYSINDTDSTPWICTSLDMSIDNPSASRYTFSVMDVNYMPNENFKISEQADPSKSRTNTTAKPTSGTPVEKESQPTDIVKIDDNHVVEYYPDREVHYVADGTDNTRSNITTYEMPLGTTPITRGNPEPEQEE